MSPAMVARLRSKGRAYTALALVPMQAPELCQEIYRGRLSYDTH